MKRLLTILVIALLMITSISSYAEDSSRYIHLEKGSKGNPVTQLQTRLKELGFYSISIDGDYGNGTANAINESIILAKGLMDEQEPTPVIFYRRGQKVETEITVY